MKIKFLFLGFLVLSLNGMFPWREMSNGEHRRTTSRQECMAFALTFLEKITEATETGCLNLDSSKLQDGINDDELNEFMNLILEANNQTHITTLSLKNNDLTLIPENILNLQTLNVLDLRNNPKLEKLPDCLGKMESLEKILITGTRVQFILLSDAVREKCFFE
ncbi:MAG: hypothetical protein ABIA74_05340 [bacterium]